jgi:hypothetical protein
MQQQQQQQQLSELLSRLFIQEPETFGKQYKTATGFPAGHKVAAVLPGSELKFVPVMNVHSTKATFLDCSKLHCLFWARFPPHDVHCLPGLVQDEGITAAHSNLWTL